MEKVYLAKKYIKWNDTKIPKRNYKALALPILAYRKKSDAIEFIKSQIKRQRTKQCDFYKVYFFIEEMNVY